MAARGRQRACNAAEATFLGTTTARRPIPRGEGRRAVKGPEDAPDEAQWPAGLLMLVAAEAGRSSAVSYPPTGRERVLEAMIPVGTSRAAP